MSQPLTTTVPAPCSFGVIRTGAISRARAWRSDLDMSSQVAIATHHHKVVAHEITVEQYKQTCASKSNHRAFLLCLIGEGRRFQKVHHSSNRDKEGGRVLWKALASHIEEQMASQDNYPTVINEIASTRLFSATAGKKTRHIVA